MFESYTDKFNGIMRRNAVDSLRKERFEEAWRDNFPALPDDVQLDFRKLGPGFTEEVKRLAWNLYESGLWAGMHEMYPDKFPEENDDADFDTEG